MITHKISKQQLLNSRENLKGLDVVNEIISCYRVDGED